MSQITVENIKRSTETASRSTRGVAAAWVNFNGTGTVAVRDSENVSSLTDSGTGNYAYNVSNSFANTNASCQGTAHAFGVAWIFSPYSAAVTASAIDFDLANSSLSAADASHCSGAAFGELA